MLVELNTLLGESTYRHVIEVLNCEVKFKMFLNEG